MDKISSFLVTRKNKCKNIGKQYFNKTNEWWNSNIIYKSIEAVKNVDYTLFISI